MPTTSQVIAGVAAAGMLATGGTLAADAAINPYSAVGNTLEIAASSTIPDAGTDTAIVSTTSPSLTLEKWNGQVHMGVTYEDLPATTTGARPFLSKNVVWNGTSQSMQVVPLAASSTFEDGGYEINIVLNSEPATNTFPFAISGANDLDFFYQAPLWQDAGLSAPTTDCTDTVCNTDGTGTSTRPDDIVGSYSVYYADHANYVEGQTNYATGKAYQIFRPQITDAVGSTTWATLSYSSGILTVTVPQSFLDDATYPVTVDPTFGYTTLGSTQIAITNGTALACSIVGSYVASAGDKFTNFSVAGNSSNAGNITLAAFSVVGGIVTNQLAAGVLLAFTNTNQFYTTSNFSQSPVAGTGYGLAFSEENFTSGNGFFYDYDSGSAPGRFSSTLTSFPGAGGGFSPTGTDSGRHYSVYVTYTAGSHFAPWQFNDF
jgi:hypothetical protein